MLEPYVMALLSQFSSSVFFVLTLVPVYTVKCHPCFIEHSGPETLHMESSEVRFFKEPHRVNFTQRNLPKESL